MRRISLHDVQRTVDEIYFILKDGLTVCVRHSTCRRTSTHFLMPDRNYVTLVRNVETRAVLAKFIHIDTSPYVKMYDAYPENSIMEDNLRAIKNKDDADTLTWLKKTLSRISKEAGYTFVVGHHPVRSVFLSDTAKKQVQCVVACRIRFFVLS